MTDLPLTNDKIRHLPQHFYDALERSSYLLNNYSFKKKTEERFEHFRGFLPLIGIDQIYEWCESISSFIQGELLTQQEFVDYQQFRSSCRAVMEEDYFQVFNKKCCKIKNDLYKIKKSSKTFDEILFN